ncbi:hypothetical protein HanPSC8_Chr17g0771521 [Helianthus annuus]|nr:hypothetical protein HanPSC8_Chr17g0771521 [Helianthus annuus]
MGLVKNWKPIIERFENKLSLWKARTLSFGGRVTLVKAVLETKHHTSGRRLLWPYMGDQETTMLFLLRAR